MDPPKKHKSRRTTKTTEISFLPQLKQATEPGGRNQVEELKARLQPLARHPRYGSALDLSDSTLRKWLNYAGNSVVFAAAKIRKSLEFKWRMHIADMISGQYTPNKLLCDYYSGGLCGADKQGSPVYYELLGTLDMEGIILSVRRDDLIKFKIYQHEAIRKYLQLLSKETGRTIDTILIVVDMLNCKKTNLWGPSLRLWAEITEILQDLYPGLVKEVLIINPPPMYLEIYLALRPYLKRSTLNLIRVFGYNFLKYLEERIPKHLIPAYLGGYKCDSDNNPHCFQDLNWLDHVPTWLRLTCPTMHADTMDVTVLAGQQHVLEHVVPMKQSRLKWEFFTISEPIIMVIYLNSLREKNSIVKEASLTMDNIHRVGELQCPVAGRYYLVLDNCKNLARNVTVSWKVAVIPPAKIPCKMSLKPIGDSINFFRPIGDKENELRRESELKALYSIPKTGAA
ncbi:unnamed protein product [Lymnaea stagnalis]|uniref:CRAL-TRIO domain-containing protein n=1 Tax=Lymnaea stagnalis TaxID=6523 RepID=A0AAV2I1W2_LYMST